jgi:metal-sulfur cluster biosynthetic enzyme
LSELDLMPAAIENALCDVEDPEIGLGIVDLGLVREVRWDAAAGLAKVVMTLTARACPAGAAIVEGVKRRLLRLSGVRAVEVELTFDPPWTPAAISAAGREKLDAK